MMRHALVACLGVTMLQGAAFAADVKADPKKAAAKDVVKEGSPEATVRQAVSGMLPQGVEITQVNKTTYGVYEVVLASGEVLYTDPAGSFFIVGTLYDIKTRSNVTQARINEINRINFADLPLTQAIKQVRGNGKRVLATFEDPNCGYCKKLAKDLTEVNDATIYTFMVPILSPDSNDKSKNIWCAPNRAKAWNDWMVDGKAPPKAECSDPIAKNSELGRKLRVSGTPTMYLADGSRIGGYVPPTELDRMMNDAEANKPKATKK
ncbi:DsbC family protein [Uliginosibacterium sp. H1]|uniref:DsbC family protein n=1 Tax=Uliginosibacterium sp. H1 TaxID=3114757 RepID=UPI002E18BD95|nr:DsbC family protein [Uliginosibacterium sp. H1]